MQQPTIRLIKFGGPWCPACNAMDKARVLDQFAAVTPEVVLLKHNVDDQGADDLIADAYDAMSMPTLIFEEIATGRELIRYEGGLNLAKLRELFADAKSILAGTGDPVKNKRQAKLSATYAPRAGGYSGVQANAETGSEIEDSKQTEQRYDDDREVDEDE